MQNCVIYFRPSGEYEGIIKGDLLYFKDPEKGLILPCEDEELYDLLTIEASGRRLHVCIDDKWGFADIDTGRVVVPPIWDFADYFHGEFAIVANGCTHVTSNDMLNSRWPTGGKWGVIDISGKLMVPLVYGKIRYFTETIDSGYNVVDMYFYQHNAIRYEVVNDKGLRGVIDPRNKVILPCRYHQ